MSLSEAIATMIQFHNRDAEAKDGCKPTMTRVEAQALARLIDHATQALDTISRAVIRRERGAR